MLTPIAAPLAPPLSPAFLVPSPRGGAPERSVRQGPFAARLAACLAVCLMACSSAPSAPAVVSRAVGPAGDTVALDGATLTVPPGALNGTVSLTCVADAQPPRPLPSTFLPATRAYAFTPHGLSFATPITVRLALPPGDTTATKVLRLRDGAASAWTEVPGVTREGGALVFTTTTFSYYVGGSGGAGCTPACGGKACGDDGCGGTCGGCTGGAECTAAGQCEVLARTPCGDLTGAAADAPWPMGRGCAARSGRSAALGPARPGIGWAFATSPPSALTAPAIGADGTLYVGSADGHLLAIHPTTGRSIWTYSTRGAVRGTPALTAARLIVAGDDAGTLHGVTTAGAATFTTALAPTALDTAPAIASDGTLYVAAAGGTLYAVDGTGTKQWEQPLGAAPRGAPAVGHNGNVYAGSADGALLAFSRAGALLWRHTVSGVSSVVSAPVATRGLIYFAGATATTGSLLVALAPDRSASWQLSPGAVLGQAAALAPDESRVYFSERGTAAFNGAIAVDAPTRRTAWQSTTPQGSGAPPVVDGAGVLYHAGLDGTVRALRPDGSEKWSVVVAQGKALGDLALGQGGVLYVVNEAEQKLHAIQDTP